jgi:hypothetical protein
MFMKRGDVGFEAVGDTLRITSLTYDAGPVHLSREDLALLGLIVQQGAPRGAASPVKRWREAVRRARGEIPRCPVAPGERSLTAGDLRLVAVDDGLDVFVLDYQAPSIEVHRAELEHLLRPASADGSLP